VPVYVRNTKKTPVVVANVDVRNNTLIKPLTITTVQTRSWIAFKRSAFGQELIASGHLVETDEAPEPEPDDDPEAA